MIEGLKKFLNTRGADFDTFNTVFDIGSRDGIQALELANAFPSAEVVAIECNPDTLERCRRNIAGNSRVRLVDKAVNEHTGRCIFYPIDPKRTVTTWKDGNPGASSLFVATGAYPVEKFVQNKIEVDCIRLDDLCKQLGVETIDLIWMDLQGAELLALQSLGYLLEKVRYIYTEVSHRAIYEGQCLFPDVESFLLSHGFRRCTEIDPNRWQQDAIYENTRDLVDVMLPLEADDLETIDLSLRSIRRFVSDVRRIFLVAESNPDIEGTHFIEARSFGDDIEACSRRFAPSGKGAELARQLARLNFTSVHRASLANVLAVDPGTIFLRKCRFIEDGRPIFNFGDHYDAAHFEHMTRLLPSLHRMFAYSGITHAMVFNRAWLEGLRKGVEVHSGSSFWNAYLEAIDTNQEECGASDYEVYFNFCLLFHASELIIRRLRWRDVESLNDLKSDRWDYVNLCRTLRADRRALKLLKEHVERGQSEPRRH